MYVQAVFLHIISVILQAKMFYYYILMFGTGRKVEFDMQISITFRRLTEPEDLYTKTSFFEYPSN